MVGLLADPAFADALFNKPPRRPSGGEGEHFSVRTVGGIVVPSVGGLWCPKTDVLLASDFDSGSGVLAVKDSLEKAKNLDD